MRNEAVTHLTGTMRRRLESWRQLNRRVAVLEGQVEELRRENDQLRRDSLRIAELADLVVERLARVE